MRIETKFTKKSGARFTQRAAALTTAVRQAEEESAMALKRQAIRLSSGPLKTDTLNRLARQVNSGKGLYSTASPSPPLDPAILNRQTGYLSRHWQTIVTWNGDGTTITLFNNAPYAKFLLYGTKLMIARPILQRAHEIGRAIRMDRLKRVMGVTLK